MSNCDGRAVYSATLVINGRVVAIEYRIFLSHECGKIPVFFFNKKPFFSLEVDEHRSTALESSVRISFIELFQVT